MTRWKYRSEVIYFAYLDDKLNDLGEEGWELVSCWDRGDGNVAFVAKRPVYEEAPWNIIAEPGWPVSTNVSWTRLGDNWEAT